MDKLTSRVLKTIARENGVKGWASMTKAKLIESLQSKEIVTDNLRVVSLILSLKREGLKATKRCATMSLLKL